jgi:hypothetical protein
VNDKPKDACAYERAEFARLSPAQALVFVLRLADFGFVPLIARVHAQVVKD